MQNKNTPIFIGLGVIVVLAIAAVGWGAYNFVLGDTEAPSGTLTAVPVAINTEAATQPAALEPSATTAGVDPVATEPEVATGGAVVFEISSDQSEASFEIDEVLGGEPKRVVGTTNQVAGQIAIDLTDLSKTQIGVIQVNARTFTTDSPNRNRMIQNRILETSQYELVTFTPTAVTGLSGPAEPGQPMTFQIEGDLTIRDITQHVVFEATVQGDSTSQITGSATTTINRSDYNLIIPSVPNVANVGEEVTLTIDFVALAAG
jgi:polyisoprenoid-binding protein YceI